MLRAASIVGGPAFPGTFSSLTVGPGQGLFAAGTHALPGLAIGASNRGFVSETGNGGQIVFSPAGLGLAAVTSTGGPGGLGGFSVHSAGYLGFSSNNTTGAADAILMRDAAHILAQKNSTNAQTFRVYNTTTGNERGLIDFRQTAGIMSFGTEGADIPMRVNTAMGLNSRVVSSSTSLTARDFSVLCSTTAAAMTVLLPAAPLPGQFINVKKISLDANRLTVDGNGLLIDGLQTASTIATNKPSFQLQFASTIPSGNTWVIL